WNGMAWSPLSSGITGAPGATAVYAVAVMPGGDLVAAGSFTAAGGTAAGNIARWNGSSWQPLGTGIPGTVRALTTFNGDLVAGGRFGVVGNNIATWTGSSWTSLGSGLQGAIGPSGPVVDSLTAFGGALIAGGQFSLAGGQPAA